MCIPAPTVVAPVPRVGPRLVAIVVALFVATAAILKCQQLLFDSPSPADSKGYRLTLLALAHIELRLAAWLVVGVSPRWSHASAARAFLCFFLVACYQALTGKVTCAWFGRFAVMPALTARMDAIPI